jgi:hypothetical protein
MGVVPGRSTQPLGFTMISGVVSEAEYVSAHKLARHRANVAISAFMVIVALAGVVLIQFSGRWGVPLIGGGVCGLVGEALLHHVVVPLRVRQLYAQVKGRTELTYSWNEHTLSLQSNRGEAERPWSDFHKARENSHVFTLYTNDAIYEIVPKRWFTDERQLADFRRHVKLT